MDALQAIRAVEPSELTGARQLAHHAAQWLARASIAALPPAAGDAHTNVGWNAEVQALVTHPLHERGVALGLHPARLELVRLHQGHREAVLALDGLTERTAGAWVAEQLAEIGADADPREVTLPYGIPGHPVAKGAPYDAAGEADALAALAGWYDFAAALLEEVRRANLDLHPGPSAVRCWPHHFDIATLILLREGDPESVPQIGVGLSPGDETLDEPYFYVTPWPVPERAPELPPPGTWHTEGFTGALAPASAVLAMDDPVAGVQDYLAAAVGFGRECF